MKRVRCGRGYPCLWWTRMGLNFTSRGLTICIISEAPFASDLGATPQVSTQMDQTRSASDRDAMYLKTHLHRMWTWVRRISCLTPNLGSVSRHDVRWTHVHIRRTSCILLRPFRSMRLNYHFFTTKNINSIHQKPDYVHHMLNSSHTTRIK